MADRQPNPQGNIVFCHECHNDWPRAEHGLTCPICGSEFTEIVEEGHDPRQPALPAPPAPSAPWEPAGEDASAPPHQSLFGDGGTYARDGRVVFDEHTVQHQTGPGHAVHFTSVIYRTSTPRNERAAGDNMPAPIFQSFQQMMRDIMGQQTPPAAGDQRQQQQPQPQPQQPQHQQNRPATSPAPGTQPREAPDGGAPPFAGGHYTSLLLGRPAMPGGPFTGTRVIYGPLWPRDANNPQPQMQPVDDLPSLLSMLVQDLAGADTDPHAHHHHHHHHDAEHAHGAAPSGAAGGDAGADGPPMNSLLRFFATFLGAPGVPHGDVVYTQEALDRVITQLMEQHAGSNAPGPASEAAIASLPRIAVDRSMLDDQLRAECTICMDEVTLGAEVMRLPCSHWFHEQCGSAWLREHDTCPICRKGIMPKEGQGDTSRAPGEEARHAEPWRAGPAARAASSASSSSLSGRPVSVPQPAPSSSGLRPSSAAASGSAASGLSTSAPTRPGMGRRQSSGLRTLSNLNPHLTVRPTSSRQHSDSALPPSAMSPSSAVAAAAQTTASSASHSGGGDRNSSSSSNNGGGSTGGGVSGGINDMFRNWFGGGSGGGNSGGGGSSSHS